MKLIVDAAIIGGGPAGMAAALSLKNNEIQNIIILEREEYLGGILLQCIHNGFGLHKFNEELTGPEYAERYTDMLNDNKIKFMTNTCVIDFAADNKDSKKIFAMSQQFGLVEIDAKAIILAMGCRERNRGNIAIPGSRPAGIMTAGLAQKLINRSGYMVGREIVILGSGDIGLIMARRMTLEGAKVKAVVEIQPYPGGLNRNIVQCLNDFNIPLYLSHTITNIKGNARVTEIDIAPINEFREPNKTEEFTVKCDALLLSVGLVPENELSLNAGILIDKVTGGPVVNSHLMTNKNGIFACGNVLHVHDLVDYVSEESETCGEMAANYIKNKIVETYEIKVTAGNLVRYVLPSTLEPNKEATISLRPMAPAENVTLYVKAGNEILFSKKFKKVFPSEMERIKIKNITKETSCVNVFFQKNSEAQA